MRFLLGCLLFLMPITLRAQELVTLSQSLILNLDAAQQHDGDASTRSSYSQTDYRFDLGMPLVAYRLGSLNLGGGLSWARQNSDGRSASALWLNTLGLSGSVFPYKPYHISFDYQRTTSPDLFGGGSYRSDTWGLGYVHVGPFFQSLHMAYRHGTVEGGGTRGSFSSIEMGTDQRHGRTHLHIKGDRLEYNLGNVTWRTTSLFAMASTVLGKDWALQNNLSSQFEQNSRRIQVFSTLSGRSGGWLSTTSLSSSDSQQPSLALRTLGLNQSLAHSWGRLSGFTSAGFAVISTSGDGASPPPSAHLTLGVIYKLNPAWSVSGDASGAWVLRQDGTGGAESQGRTLHAGLAWGGDLPEQLAHNLYYWTNLRFQRRLQEDYPPGYLPPDMTSLVLKRRLEQSGSLNFSSDIYRNDNDRGHETWYRARGGVSLRTGLMIQVMGDLRVGRRTLGHEGTSLQSDAQNVSMLAIQQMGRGSVSFSFGHYSNSQTAGSLQNAGPLTSTSGSSTSYALGANGLLAGMPVGGNLNRSIDATGFTTNLLSTYTQAGYGKLQFRILYQHGWRSNGSRGDQIGLTLLRTFDTIPLWGGED